MLILNQALFNSHCWKSQERTFRRTQTIQHCQSAQITEFVDSIPRYPRRSQALRYLVEVRIVSDPTQRLNGPVSPAKPGRSRLLQPPAARGNAHHVSHGYLLKRVSGANLFTPTHDGCLGFYAAKRSTIDSIPRASVQNFWTGFDMSIAWLPGGQVMKTWHQLSLLTTPYSTGMPPIEIPAHLQDTTA